MLPAFDESDQVLLVTTLDIPALKNLKLTLETLDLLNFPSRAGSWCSTGPTPRSASPPSEVEKTLAMKIEVSIPTSSHVPAINSGVPITSDRPSTPSARP